MNELIAALEPRLKLAFGLVEAELGEVLRVGTAQHYHLCPWGDDDDPEDVIERQRLLRGSEAQPGIEFGDAWFQEMTNYWAKTESDSEIWSEVFSPESLEENNFLSLAGGTRLSQVEAMPGFVFIEGTYGRGLHELNADYLSLWLKRPVYVFNSETAERNPPNPQMKELGPPRPMQNHYMMRRDPMNGHRVIQAHLNYSGRWQLFQFGDPLPFENPDYYKRRRVLDRFNREIMLEYLANLGIDPWALLVEHRVLNPVLTTCDPKGELVPPNAADVARFVEISEQLEQLKPKPYRA